MKISAAFPSRYLKSSDLQGREVKVTINCVEMETIGEDSRPVLYFKGKEKGLVLNKTNSNTIADMFGDDTDAWEGKEIALYATRVDFKGERVDAIRVQFSQAPAKPKQPVKAEMNDDIPF